MMRIHHDILTPVPQCILDAILSSITSIQHNAAVSLFQLVFGFKLPHFELQLNGSESECSLHGRSGEVLQVVSLRP